MRQYDDKKTYEELVKENEKLKKECDYYKDLLDYIQGLSNINTKKRVREYLKSKN